MVVKAKDFSFTRYDGVDAGDGECSHYRKDVAYQRSQKKIQASSGFNPVEGCFDVGNEIKGLL